MIGQFIPTPVAGAEAVGGWRWLKVWETKDDVYIFMEACMGGELFDVIIQRGHISESDAALVASVILEVSSIHLSLPCWLPCSFRPHQELWSCYRSAQLNIMLANGKPVIRSSADRYSKLIPGDQWTSMRIMHL